MNAEHQRLVERLRQIRHNTGVTSEALFSAIDREAVRLEACEAGAVALLLTDRLDALARWPILSDLAKRQLKEVSADIRTLAARGWPKSGECPHHHQTSDIADVYRCDACGKTSLDFARARVKTLEKIAAYYLEHGSTPELRNMCLAAMKKE